MCFSKMYIFILPVKMLAAVSKLRQTMIFKHLYFTIHFYEKGESEDI